MIYPDRWNEIFEHYNRKDHFRFFEANGPPIDPRPLDKLTENHVRTMLENDLSWQGNSRLKVGDVKTGEDGNIIGDILTQDGTLVDRWSVDPDNGSMQRVQ